MWLRGRKYGYEGENTVRREKIRCRERKYAYEGENKLSREKLRFRGKDYDYEGKNTLAMERTDLLSKKHGYVGENVDTEDGTQRRKGHVRVDRGREMLAENEVEAGRKSSHDCNLRKRIGSRRAIV